MDPRHLPRRDTPPAGSPLPTAGSGHWPLHRKIDAWLEENRRRRASGDPAGPENKAELARELKRPATSIGNWYPPAKSLPGGHTAADLENLMGARLAYLLDTAMPWPPRMTLAEELVNGTLVGWTRDELDTLALIQRDPRMVTELLRLVRRARKEGG